MKIQLKFKKSENTHYFRCENYNEDFLKTFGRTWNIIEITPRWKYVMHERLSKYSSMNEYECVERGARPKNNLHGDFSKLKQNSIDSHWLFRLFLIILGVQRKGFTK